jgi:hypothetical protein
VRGFEGIADQILSGRSDEGKINQHLLVASGNAFIIGNKVKV